MSSDRSRQYPPDPSRRAAAVVAEVVAAAVSQGRASRPNNTMSSRQLPTSRPPQARSAEENLFSAESRNHPAHTRLAH
jgi:hypothetical protein